MLCPFCSRACDPVRKPVGQLVEEGALSRYRKFSIDTFLLVFYFEFKIMQDFFNIGRQVFTQMSICSVLL